jgi:alginate O-acetyltransferase complex protein AlgI
LIVFLLSGIWHGANWTFVIWGLLHGCYMLIGHFTGGGRNRKPGQTGNVLVNLFHRTKVFLLVTLAWVFFRAQNLSQALYVLKKMFVGLPKQMSGILHNYDYSRLKLLYLDQPAGEFVIAVLGIILLIGVQYGQKNMEFGEWLTTRPVRVRWVSYYALVLSFVLLGVFNKSEFIYFQF